VWEPSPEQAQALKIMAAGGFGALVLVYLRHPGTLFRVGCMVAIGIGMASIFTHDIAAILGLREVPVAAVIGLGSKAIAEKALKWAEALDFAKLKKGDGL